MAFSANLLEQGAGIRLDWQLKMRVLTGYEPLTQRYQSKPLKPRHTTTSSIFQRALNREIFETAECLEREKCHLIL